MMPLYRNADKVILFIHIPKTGGSTVENVLRAAGAAQALKGHKRVGFSHSTPQHMQWTVTRQWIPQSFYDYSMAVVRNPFARIASEYRWRVGMSSAPLPDFNKWIASRFRAYETDNYILDNHIRPQNHFVGKDVDVFRLEDGLDAPILAGMARLGLPPERATIQHANRTKPMPLPASSSTIARIAQFYSEDFRIFGYSPSETPDGLFCEFAARSS